MCVIPFLFPLPQTSDRRELQVFANLGVLSKRRTNSRGPY